MSIPIPDHLLPGNVEEVRPSAFGSIIGSTPDGPMLAVFFERPQARALVVVLSAEEADELATALNAAAAILRKERRP